MSPFANIQHGAASIDFPAMIHSTAKSYHTLQSGTRNNIYIYNCKLVSSDSSKKNDRCCIGYNPKPLSGNSKLKNLPGSKPVPSNTQENHFRPRKLRNYESNHLIVA